MASPDNYNRRAELTLQKCTFDIEMELALTEQVAIVNLIRHIANIIGNTVGDDDIGFFLYWCQVIHHSGM